jgi:outer membrane protein TolC
LEIRKFASTLIAENHKVASKLFEVGKAPKTDVLRAEVQLSSARQEIMSAENLVNLTKHAFNQTLNRDSQSEIKSENSPINDMIKPEFRKSLEFEGNTETLTVTALNNRPELSQLESGINAVNSFRKATVSDYLPSLTLVADYGIQGEKYQFDDQSRYWMVSGIFKWNLFSGFETSAKSQEMQAQINSLQKSSESLKQLINLEIQNNYYNYKNSYDQYDVAVKSYLSANENYDLNKKRYEEGLNPFISLLDAETTLKLTMENLYMTYYDVLTAKWKLNKSIGNLFK